MRLATVRRLLASQCATLTLADRSLLGSKQREKKMILYLRPRGTCFGPDPSDWMNSRRRMIRAPNCSYLTPNATILWDNFLSSPIT